MNRARSRSLVALLLAVATAAIASAAEESDVEQLHVVLLPDEKDHGPAGNGLHDYPLWQKRWSLWRWTRHKPWSSRQCNTAC